MVFGSGTLTNIMGFREHNGRLREGPRRNYDVPLSDGRPHAVIPSYQERFSPGFVECRVCRAPVHSCPHGTRGLNPNRGRRYGSRRPDRLPIGRDRRQGYYLDDQSYTSPFYREDRGRRSRYIDDEFQDDSASDNSSGEYYDGYNKEIAWGNAVNHLYPHNEDQSGRRQSHHRERERPYHHRDLSHDYGERHSDYSLVRNNPYDDESTYGRGRRNRADHMMYGPSGSETVLSY